MADKAEPLAKLKTELKNVKEKIKEIESITYASQSVIGKRLYILLLQKKKRLSDEIDAFKGLLIIVSHFI